MAFVAPTSAFSGLTAPDLAGRARRRPVPLLNTSWPTKRRKRRKGEVMQKEITGLVEQLKKSATEIMMSGVDDREALLTKSFGEFTDALTSQIAPVLPEEEEPLEKGLNHIASFASTLRMVANDVQRMKGKPGNYYPSDSYEREELPEEIAAMMDNVVHMGVLTLQQMVNDTVILPADDDAVGKAEAAGTLAKIAMTDGTDLDVITPLPEKYHDLLVDPLTLAAKWGDAARGVRKNTITLLKSLAQVEDGIPDDFIEAYPEFFEQPVRKAFGKPFGRKKDDEADDGTTTEGDGEGADTTGEDDEEGQDDGTGTADDTDGAMTGDDTPTNHLELLTRLLSVSLVIAGAMAQAAGINTGADQGDTDPMDATGVGAGNMAGGIGGSAPLRRSGDGDLTLAKIYAGEVVVPDDLADALEELDRLKAEAGEVAELRKQASEVESTKRDLAKLQETIERLGKMAAPAKGAVSTVAVGKAGDVSGAGAKSNDDRARELVELSKRDPHRAAAELIKSVHAAGGMPLIPSMMPPDAVAPLRG